MRSNNTGSSSSSSTGSAQGGRARGAAHKGFVPPGSSLMNHGSEADGSPQQPHTTAATPATAGSNGSSALPALVRPDVLQHFSNHPDVEAALEQVLQYGQRLLLLRANDWSALAAEGGTGEEGPVSAA